MRRLLSHVGRADPGAAVVFDDWPLPPPAPPTDRSEVRAAGRRWVLKARPDETTPHVITLRADPQPPQGDRT